MSKFKVRCTKTISGRYINGKIYNVDERGGMLDEYGVKGFPCTTESFGDWYRACRWNDYAFELVTDNTYELHITCNDGKTTNAVYKVNGKIEKREKAVRSPSDTFNFATGAQTAFDRVFPKATPARPIAPQEDKARFEVGQKVKVIGNCCCHGYSRGTILTLVRSVNFLRREPDWYVGEGTYYVSERDIEPYAEPEKEPEPVYLNMKVVCTDGDSSFYAGKVYEFINGKVKDKDGDERPQPLNPTSGRASNFEQFYKAYCGEAKFIPYLGEA